MSEVSALLQLFVQLACLTIGGLDFLRGSAVADRNEDIGQTELFGELHFAQVRSEEVLHFLIRNLNALGHAALTHTADDHLATYLLPSIGIGQAVSRECGLELFKAHAVTLCDGADGLVQLFIGDPNAGALADLQLNIFNNQPLQHLLAEHVLGWQRCTALGDGLLHFTQPRIELTLHDHIVINNRHDTVEGANFSLCRSTQQQRAQQQRAHAIRKLCLHVHDNLECLGRGKSQLYCRLHHPDL